MTAHHRYSEEERQGFSLYIGARAAVRPQACHGGEACWVAEGPPAYTTRQPGPPGNKGGYCVGCGGSPALPHDKRGTYTR